MRAIRRAKRIANRLFSRSAHEDGWRLSHTICPVKRKYHQISNYAGDKTYYMNDTYLKFEQIMNLFERSTSVQ